MFNNHRKGIAVSTVIRADVNTQCRWDHHQLSNQSSSIKIVYGVIIFIMKDCLQLSEKGLRLRLSLFLSIKLKSWFHYIVSSMFLTCHPPLWCHVNSINRMRISNTSCQMCQHGIFIMMILLVDIIIQRRRCILIRRHRCHQDCKETSQYNWNDHYLHDNVCALKKE